MTPEAFWSLAREFGFPVAALVVVLLAWSKEWFVSQAAFRRQCDETEYWRNVAERALSIGESAQDVTRKAISAAKSPRRRV